MAQGAMCHREDGKVVAMNPAAMQVLGMSASEMSESGKYYWVHPDKAKYAEGTEPWNRVLQTGTPVKDELMGFCRLSSVLCRWVIVSSLILPSDFAEPGTRAFTTFQDVTAQILMQEQLERAVTKQQQSLDVIQGALRSPKLEIVAGYRIAEMNSSAVPDTQICGDVYDSFVSVCGNQCVMVADVSGKGLESADLAIRAKETIHAYAFEGHPVAQVFNLTNKVLYRDQLQKGGFGKFVTAAMLSIDPPTGQFSFVNAGHEAVAVCHPDGNVSFLPCCKSQPLGIFDETSYENSSHLLPKGGKLVLYTDGLSDARNQSGEMFIGHQFEACLRSFGNLDANGLLSRLVWCVKEWAATITDDLTIVVVERLRD